MSQQQQYPAYPNAYGQGQQMEWYQRPIYSIDVECVGKWHIAHIQCSIILQHVHVSDICFFPVMCVRAFPLATGNNYPIYTLSVTHNVTTRADTFSPVHSIAQVPVITIVPSRT